MEVPSCVIPEHAGGRVVRAGLYGKRPHQRQRWKCVPVNGDPPHRFADVLPRQRAKIHACLECETHLEPWEGQQVARRYDFTTREIARSLIRVAQGLSYRSTADLVRDAAGRRRGPSTAPAPKGKRNRDPNTHGQLVCNWVDALADVIWSAYAPTEWPARLVLDAGEFRTSHTLPNGGRSSRTHRAFFILAAVGYAPGDTRPRVWAMQAHGRENQSTWATLLGEFDGTPELIVTDGGQRAINAVGAVFPRPGDQAPELRRCEWHLGKNARDTLPAHIAKDPDHELMRALRVAFWSPDDWHRFEELTNDHAGRTGGLKGLQKWVTTNSSAISAHVATRPALGPHSVGAVEERLREVGRRIGDRAGAFGNQTRTNRLLRLMTLEMNGQADELAWADIIRRHLLATGGYAPEQRQNDDPHGHRSIRA